MPRIARPTAPAEPEFEAEVDEFEEGETVEQTPARPARRAAASDDESEPRSRSRRNADEDEDDEPRGASPIGAGWGEFKKKRASSGDFPEELKVDKDAVLVAFVDNEPFAVYREHWIERPGKKSFVCLERDCPLCDAGDNRPRVKTSFNVVLMDSAGSTLKIWTTGPRLTGQLAALDADEKTGPLTKGYWSVKRTGTGTKTAYNISPVKERDVAEDWSVEPLNDEEFDAFDAEKYDSSAITFSTKRQLLEVAAEINED